MNLHHLRYFVALADIQHYGQAADRLCITQPSLSHAISQLESELGVLLFHRKRRGIELSKEGQLFLDAVTQSLDILDSSVSTLQRAAQGEGIIQLGFLRILGLSFIPEVVADYLDLRPEKQISFQFSTALSRPLINELKEGHHDIIFCTKLAGEDSVNFVPVARQDVVLIVPLSHPLAAFDSVELSQTLPYSHVYFSHKSGVRTIIDGLFHQIDAHPNIAYELDEDQVIAGMVAQGFGIAVVPYIADLARLNLKVVQIHQPVWNRDFYMAALKNRKLSPVAQDFWDYVVETCDPNTTTF